ncbi:hypothetical protein BB560_004659 [Smittium megazygosporum]|uniref:Uncharacterized protein n=1 Tax=Smittium megazygosporum TaxID=133381 RepID=A0A2T9Z8N5_9FUNG|nr:hypothetical protein BB560_004659 [Smittium megazygosporum]
MTGPCFLVITDLPLCGSGMNSAEGISIGFVIDICIRSRYHFPDFHHGVTEFTVSFFLSYLLDYLLYQAPGGQHYASSMNTFENLK